MNRITSCLKLVKFVSRDVLWVNRSVWLFCTEASSKSSAQLRAFRTQEQRFRRKLRSVHRKFADVPSECLKFQGSHHAYFEDGRSIYRSARGHDEMVEVFNTDWAGEGYESIQRVRLSPQEKILVASVKKCQQEETRCVLVRLGEATFHHKVLMLVDNVFSFEWASEEVLFYSTLERLQSLAVYRINLRDAVIQPTLLYNEKDPEFFVEVSCSRDQRLVMVNCNSKSSSEVWFVDSRAPLSQLKLVQPRLPGLIYHVEHASNHLFILANTGPSKEYQLLRTQIAWPSMAHWQLWFTAVPGTVIKDMELLEDHCVFTVRDSQCRLHIQTINSKVPGHINTLQLPLWVCDVSSQRIGTVGKDSFSFISSSPVHPPLHFHFSPGDQQLSVAEDDNHSIFLPECKITRLQAASQDGTLVPLTLFHMPMIADLSNAPLLLHVYGAYGVDLSMTFSPEKRLLLEDGWALAYCHVRGGGEQGLSWHRGGAVLQKQRGVEDFLACIQTLHGLGVSQPALTALIACSAGAVLAGALCNQSPQLLKAAILQAPFLDVLGAMQDPLLPLTIEERGEWGDPLIPEHRDNIASYCPCHNIVPQLYPSVLISAYSEDCRVPLSGVLKYVGRLKKAVQTYASQDGAHCPTVRLDIRPGGDHFGPVDFNLSLNETARQLAFLYTELGLNRQKTKDENGSHYNSVSK